MIDLSQIQHLLILVLIGEGLLVLLVLFLLGAVGSLPGRVQRVINVLHDIADELERSRKNLASRKD